MKKKQSIFATRGFGGNRGHTGGPAIFFLLGRKGGYTKTPPPPPSYRTQKAPQL